MKQRYLFANGSIYEVDGADADGRKIVTTARKYGAWNGDSVYLVEGEEILYDRSGFPINVVAWARHWTELHDYLKCGK